MRLDRQFSHENETSQSSSLSPLQGVRPSRDCTSMREKERSGRMYDYEQKPEGYGGRYVRQAAAQS